MKTNTSHLIIDGGIWKVDYDKKTVTYQDSYDDSVNYIDVKDGSSLDEYLEDQNFEVIEKDSTWDKIRIKKIDDKDE